MFFFFTGFEAWLGPCYLNQNYKDGYWQYFLRYRAFTLIAISQNVNAIAQNHPKNSKSRTARQKKHYEFALFEGKERYRRL